MFAKLTVGNLDVRQGKGNGMSICTLAVKALRTEMSTANMRNNTKEAPTTDLSIMRISSVAHIAA